MFRLSDYSDGNGGIYEMRSLIRGRGEAIPILYWGG